MSAPTLDQHIYNMISPQRGSIEEHIIYNLASNIAFLIRYAYGPFIDLNCVSVLVIGGRNKNRYKIGPKAAVVVHANGGKFTTIIEKQVQGDDNVILGLAEKVDTAILDVLVKEGNKGFRGIA